MTWQSGATVHVNRGQNDWEVAGKILPQYGYSAALGAIESSIERIEGVIVEQSRSAGRLYVNARGRNPDNLLPITPQAKEIVYLGGRRFTLPVLWQARQSAPLDLMVFLHFKSSRSQREDEIAFQGDYLPAIGTSTWQGNVSTGGDRAIEIPAALGAGHYEVHVGLFDPKTGARYGLDADETGHQSYAIGRLVAEGEGANVTHIALVPHQIAVRPAPRWNVGRKPVSFGPLRTTGAVRCEWNVDRMILTPLPNEPSCAITLDVSALTKRARTPPYTVRAVDRHGVFLHAIPADVSGSTLTFVTDPPVFAYEIEPQREGSSRTRANDGVL